mmetsp:Transcript_16211/g.25689  ORF Transcript_16211/g.25689 Transcript_16211/m.25689 type:complete len:361 (-) Transcript_16211:98-1180(-)
MEVLFKSIHEMTERDLVKVLRKASKLGLSLKDARDLQGMTLLHHTSRLGYRSATRLLLEEGIGINVRETIGGDMALHMACRARHGKLASLLVENGAILGARNRDGISPLSLDLFKYLKAYPPKKKRGWISKTDSPEKLKNKIFLEAKAEDEEGQRFLTDEELHNAQLRLRNMHHAQKRARAEAQRLESLKAELQKREREEKEKEEAIQRQIDQEASTQAQYAQRHIPKPEITQTTPDYIPSASNQGSIHLRSSEKVLQQMEKGWKTFSARVKAAGSGTIRSVEIPVPGEKSPQNDVLEALRTLIKADRTRGLKEIRRLCLRWHPDKFTRKFGSKISPSDRLAVQRQVQTFVQNVMRLRVS